MACDTKQNILDAALELFAEKGYEGTNLRDLASAAGISKSALYRHFDSKEAIWNCLLDQVERYYQTGFSQALTAIGTPTSFDSLLAISQQQVEFTLGDQRIVKVRKLLTQEQFHNQRSATLATTHLTTGLTQLYKQLFSSLMDAGVMRAGNPQLTAFEYVAPISALIQQCDREPQNAPQIKARIQEFAQFFCTEHAASPQHAPSAQVPSTTRAQQAAAYYADKQFEFGWASLCWMNLPENLEGLTVLDLGCRRGKGVFKISDKVGAQGLAIGVDWVESYIDEAARKSQRAWQDTGLPRNNMQFAYGFPEDLAACGIANASVDVVYINSVFNLLYDPATALAEFNRVLKPGGLLVIEAVTASDARDAHVVAQARDLGNSVQAAPAHADFLMLLAQAGFTVERTLEQHPVAVDEGYKKDFKAPTAPSQESVTFTAAVFHARK